MQINPLYFVNEKLKASLHGLVCANCPSGHRRAPRVRIVRLGSNIETDIVFSDIISLILSRP